MSFSGRISLRWLNLNKFWLKATFCLPLVTWLEDTLSGVIFWGTFVARLLTSAWSFSLPLETRLRNVSELEDTLGAIVWGTLFCAPCMASLNCSTVRFLSTRWEDTLLTRLTTGSRLENVICRSEGLTGWSFFSAYIHHLQESTLSACLKTILCFIRYSRLNVLNGHCLHKKTRRREARSAKASGFLAGCTANCWGICCLSEDFRVGLWDCCLNTFSSCLTIFFFTVPLFKSDSWRSASWGLLTTLASTRDLSARNEGWTRSWAGCCCRGSW